MSAPAATALQLAHLSAQVAQAGQVVAELERALRALATEQPVPASLARVIGPVCREFDVVPADLTGRTRIERIAHARQVAFHLVRRTTKLSLQEIGHHFGRDHGTVMHALRAVANRMDTQPVFAAQVRRLEAELANPEPMP